MEINSNLDIITEFKLLAKKLQSDDRLVYLDQARKVNDMDQELQALISKLNQVQLDYRVEAVKEDKDEEKIDRLYNEYMDLYDRIMANDSMKQYTECKNEADSLRNYINAIITAAFEGGDPMIVEMPDVSCTGDCSTCGGSCGN